MRICSVRKPGALCRRHAKFKNLEAWRAEDVTKTHELLLITKTHWKPESKVSRSFEYDGLSMEELSWQLPYGPRTRAVFMKPVGATGRPGRAGQGRLPTRGLSWVTVTSTVSSLPFGEQPVVKPLAWAKKYTDVSTTDLLIEVRPNAPSGRYDLHLTK